jgi:hypothetical protein
MASSKGLRCRFLLVGENYFLPKHLNFRAPKVKALMAHGTTSGRAL